ncbi:hypothetical protein MKQ70_32900 [Chitinophaga sedimenti]|uniref:hypothetical protein n=1 Tax=Chitinophaga sedimenti TaxID=2033606 RepID=UPI0020040A4F|nr:hypothetical protein [Chitinophaga sedimenti]MCK7559510.1 hypothetical protein [Chitinophaga sedimenti]
MKYPILLLLVLMACNQPSNPEDRIMGARKAAIFRKIFYDVPTLFDPSQPLGHPIKVEEIVIKGPSDYIDTFYFEYFYEQGRLVKVTDKKRGRPDHLITLKYDELNRLTLIDETVNGRPFDKDTFYFHEKDIFQASRDRYMDGKPEEWDMFKYYGKDDSLKIAMRGQEKEMCYFRESNDTMYVHRVWRNDKDILMSDRLEAYDKQNNLVRSTAYESGKVDRITCYTYDQYGNQLSRTSEDDNNIIGGSAGIVAISTPDSSYINYVYDKTGNWTSKEEKFTSSYTYIVKRKITYAKEP